MFNALDHLNGIQLLAVLSPIVLIMGFIRWREDKAQSLNIENLNRLQKGWIFLTFLSPGLSARVLAALSAEERERLLEAGGLLSGSPTSVAYPILELFFKAEGGKGVPSKDIDEVCRFLNLRYEDDSSRLTSLYRAAYL